MDEQGQNSRGIFFYIELHPNINLSDLRKHPKFGDRTGRKDWGFPSVHTTTLVIF